MMCRKKIGTIRFLVCLLVSSSSRFAVSFSPSYQAITSTRIPLSSRHYPSRASTITLRKSFNDDDSELKQTQEKARLDVLKSRRGMIRNTLKSAEEFRYFRVSNGFVPKIGADGKPESDSKAALSITAFAVAAGVVALRIGGRAALVSAVGLDFANDNPELAQQLENILNFAHDLNPVTEALLFIAAWTAVKVFLFDAGGIALALSSGILFGGVFQGALFSALAATIGSCVCFLLAKADTPIRKKALDLVEENPSLRGIEKVVAEDGFKAILTLRLAPLLPIPLGMYNYVYGVTNVPFRDFALGIFLGSIKPYLLDSYLGVFGKDVVEGTFGDGTSYQDIILILAIGLSVLIGVFASQLATETWDSVLEEINTERKGKEESGEIEVDDGIKREFFGLEVPDWLVGLQLQIAMANERMNSLVDEEMDAKVWNYTKEERMPASLDPSLTLASPEISQVYTGFDFVEQTFDGLVLSPVLFGVFTRFQNPMFDEEKEVSQRPNRRLIRDKVAAEARLAAAQQESTSATTGLRSSGTTSSEKWGPSQLFTPEMTSEEVLQAARREFGISDRQQYLEQVSGMKTTTKERLKKLEQRLDDKDGTS